MRGQISMNPQLATMNDPSTYSGGLTVSREMRKILKQPRKHLRALQDGGQLLRTLYVNGSASFDPTQMSKFAQYCFLGQLNSVRHLIETKSVPNLKGKETAYEWGYATLVIVGAQRTQDPRTQHAETLAYILENGVPPDSEDIVCLTALHHIFASPRETSTDLIRVLVSHGADVNHQDRYGCVPLISGLMRSYPKGIDVLLECGASLDIPEADGLTARNFYIKCGPQVTAVVTKWIRKRAGEAELPREGGLKACNAAGCKAGVDGKEVDLKSCSRCKIARYCSAECQKKAWPTHKKTCKPFDSTTTVVLKPTFGAPDGAAHYANVPLARLAREHFGMNAGEAAPDREFRGNQVPREMGKSVVIKVQASVKARTGKMEDGNELSVYTKKRDIVCRIVWKDQPDAQTRAGYGKIVDVIKTKGTEGLKAYFVAELKSKEELVVKISDVLAEQPF